MSRKNLMVRLFRALSGQTQRDFARTAGVDESLLARYELGLVEPGLEPLARMAEVFESKGVHREALAALRLFQEAAEREEATADLARRVLGYLFRARHDQGLRFTL